MWKRIPDNFFIGVLAGSGLLCLTTLAIDAWRRYAYPVNAPSFWQEPKPELVALLLNILLFRLTIRKSEKTSQGILFATVLLVVGYYFIKARHLGS